MRSTIRAMQIAIVCGLFGLWEVCSALGIVDPRLLPRFSDVLVTGYELIGRRETVVNLATTASVVAVSFILSAILGTLIGLALVESRFVRDILQKPLFFLFGIPKSIFLPIFILAFGIGTDQKVIYGLFTTVFFIAIAIVAACDSVKPDYIKVGRAWGASRLQIALHIYLPSVLPALIETARIAMIFNITGILLAEMYASRVGIGHSISSWAENFQIRELLAGILVVSLLAIAFNEMLRWLEYRWSYEAEDRS